MLEHEYLKYLEQWEETAFRDFMAEYGQDVWNFTYFMTRRNDLADDLT